MVYDVKWILERTVVELGNLKNWYNWDSMFLREERFSQHSTYNFTN